MGLSVNKAKGFGNEAGDHSLKDRPWRGDLPRRQTKTWKTKRTPTWYFNISATEKIILQRKVKQSNRLILAQRSIFVLRRARVRDWWNSQRIQNLRTEAVARGVQETKERGVLWPLHKRQVPESQGSLSLQQKTLPRHHYPKHWRILRKLSTFECLSQSRLQTHPLCWRRSRVRGGTGKGTLQEKGGIGRVGQLWHAVLRFQDSG